MKRLVLAKPNRKFHIAIRYWKPYRLTLDRPGNPKIMAWLWWNY
jgi:hypothetical protein